MKKINIKNINTENIKIHFIGIGGISMSAIAIVLKKAGYVITGSDKNESEMVDILRKNNIPVYIGSNAELVKDVDIVVYTSAINQHDVEFVRAKHLNIPVYERAVFLGMILENYKNTICISGTHGKTTTTAMTSSIFIDANLKPNVQVGSTLKKINNLNFLTGDSEYFILESCEYVDSFLNFPHETATILNIEKDHLDYFSSIDEIKESFKKFILMTKNNGNVIINIDDEDCKDIIDNIRDELTLKNIRIITFSLYNEEADIYASNLSCNIKGFYSFSLHVKDKLTTYEFYLTVPGIHNVYDALASISTAYAFGINFKVMKKSLNEFSGTHRRFELKNELKNNILVYDDYAHHPTEIKATLAAAKQKNMNRVIGIFQPHTYSRTKELIDDFAVSFSNSDLLIITDIYAAREIDDGTIHSKTLADKIKANGINCIYIKEFEDIVKYLKDNLKDNDLVITLGAGDITKLSDMITK